MTQAQNSRFLPLRATATASAVRKPLLVANGGDGVGMLTVENKRPRRIRRGRLQTGNPQSDDFDQFDLLEVMQAPSSRIPPVRAAAVASDLYKPPCACLQQDCAP